MISYIRRFVEYRELFLTFTWRNVLLQYSNPLLGLFWGVVSPLLMTTIFFVALDEKVGVDFADYFIFIYSGFVCWNLFAGGLGHALVCFLQNDNLVKTIFFPRFLLPLTFLAAKIIDFLIALILLSVVIWWSDGTFHWDRVGFYFLGVFQLLMVSVGFYLILSVVCVRFRGFQVVYPFVSQALFFTSSVVYDASITVEDALLRQVFEWNPISTVLSTFRLAVFYDTVDWSLVLIHTAYAAIICLIGCFWFKIEDKHLVDRL